MILAHGILYEDDQLPRLRAELERDCLDTLAAQSITAELVIGACDQLVRKVEAGAYDHILAPFLTAFSIDPGQFQAALGLFRRESLEYKVAMELGADPAKTPLRHNGFSPSGGGGSPWGSCSTSPPEMWTDCRPTAWWRACWLGTSTS